MQDTIQIINKVLPVILLILLGYWLRRSHFLREGTMDDLRKLVVGVALPSVLFLTFLQLELKISYLVIFCMVFLVCLGMFGLGFWLQKQFRIPQAYFPFMMTGFEYGMLGVSLFGGAYGMQKLGFIAVMALGHELFIWFVFLAFLLTRRDGIRETRLLLGTFFKSPVIIAILAGLVLNLLGVKTLLPDIFLAGALLSVFQFLANLVVPLILLIVGYSIQFDLKGLRAALSFPLLRLGILIPLALLMNTFVLRGWLHMEPTFEAALFTLFVLPPPFIIPMYMPAGMSEEKHYVNNVLALYTLFSITIFILYFLTRQLGGSL
jgi:predicted permease